MPPRIDQSEPTPNNGMLRRPSVVGPNRNQRRGTDIDQALVNTDGWANMNVSTKRRELWEAIGRDAMEMQTQLEALGKADGRERIDDEQAEVKKRGRAEFRRAYQKAVSDCLVNDMGYSPRPRGATRQRQREPEIVTILHDLIQSVPVEDFRSSELYLELVDMSLERLWDRYGLSGLRNVLYKAIEHGSYNMDLIMAICLVPERKDRNMRKMIATAIAHTVVTPQTGGNPGGEENCLHAAIGYRVPPAVLDALVRYADETALKSKRTPEDNTPLHDFVEMTSSICSCECRKCLETIDDVFFNEQKLAAAVEATLVRMIDRYEEALSTTNKDGKTPYMLHRETRRKDRGDNSWDDLEFEPPEKAMATENSAKDEAASRILVINKTIENRGAQEGDKLPEPNSKKGVRSGPQSIQMKPQVGHMTDDQWNFSRHVARTVSAKLLDRCCSRQSWDKAVKSIFGDPGPERNRLQTSFILKGGLYEGFERDCGYMPLSPILSYVELKLCQGTPNANADYRNTERTAQTKSPQLVRSANVQKLHSVFLWLKQAKGVKRILKLVIIDNQEWQCSDETIQDCLADWDVRYLEWNKRDLSVDAVSRGGAEGLIELRLAWSGQNTALIGWSHPDCGIGSFLPKLRRVHIDVPSSIESDERMRVNLENFGKRLKEAFPSIAFTPPQDVKSSLARDRARDRAKVPDRSEEKHHRWMEAVQNFRREAMATSHQLRLDSDLHKHVVKNPIKVALIDDGVDLKDLDYKGLVKDGWPLDIPDEDRIATTYYESTEGHGTAMANLIHFVCPEAHLYVAKLESSPPKVYKCVAGMAADAVTWAISKDVDIISTSWTIKNEQQRNEDVQRLNDAMFEAQQKGIILFCSFNDVGNHSSDEDKLLPSTKDVPLLRRVGSCDGNGKESNFVNKKLVQYLFPGEQLSQFQQIRGRAGTDKGSSASTALASGLAALVLWCVVRLEGDKKEFGNKRMYKLFDAMKTDSDKSQGSLVDVSADMDSARKRGGNPITIVDIFVKGLRGKIANEISEWQGTQGGGSKADGPG